MLDHKDHQEQMVDQVLWEMRGQLVPKANREDLDLVDRQVREETQELRDHQDQEEIVEQLAHRAQMEHWDCQVQLVILDQVVTLALQDHLDLKEAQEQEEIQVREVTMDQLVQQVHEEIRDSKVQRV